MNRRNRRAPGEIAGDIRNVAAIGVHNLIFDVCGESIAKIIARLQRVAIKDTGRLHLEFPPAPRLASVFDEG
jgi:hypothetical protein